MTEHATGAILPVTHPYPYAEGEWCGICRRRTVARLVRLAAHKVEEVTDDPRHPFTQYLCCEHFALVMGGVALRTCARFGAIETGTSDARCPDEDPREGSSSDRNERGVAPAVRTRGTDIPAPASREYYVINDRSGQIHTVVMTSKTQAEVQALFLDGYSVTLTPTDAQLEALPVLPRAAMMPTAIDVAFDSQFLRFLQVDDTGKTKVWWVMSRTRGDVLGHIKWYGRWRQYAFYPASDTLWNPGCLADVQRFMTEQMEARKR